MIDTKIHFWNLVLRSPRGALSPWFKSPNIDGYQLYHNFVRPHIGLNGKTPAEACGIEIQGENKWKTLIQNARKK